MFNRSFWFGLESRLLLLSMASGAADAISLFKLKNVFTSAMSGNTVLLALAIGKGDLPQGERVATALLAFIVGLFVAAFPVSWKAKKKQWNGAVTFAVFIELLCLCGFLWLWFRSGQHPAGVPLFFIIGLVAAAMGMQSAIALHLKIPGVATTYFTGTLTNIVLGFSEDTVRPAEAPASRRTFFQASIYFSYLASAVAAAFSLVHLRALAVCLPLLAVTLVIVAALVGGPQQG